VAHRLSTIRAADHIYVLHQGRVVEQGTHGQLLVQEGRYWELVRAQADDGVIPPRPGIATANGNGRADGEEVEHAR
jgi:ABC-type transport system involved in cytochrome bd biosynthesis fused ATPase/permease subunit